MTAVLSRSIYVGLVLILWMPLIISPHTWYPFIVGKALFARTVIEITVALWLVLLVMDPTYRPPRSWIILAFGVYVIVSFFSAVFGVNFTHSLWSDFQRMMGVWDLIHWFLLALVAASVLRSPRAWRTLLNWNLVVALALSLVALTQIVGFPELKYINYSCKIDGTLGNPSYLAVILAVSSLVAAGFLARSFLTAEDGDGTSPPGAPPNTTRSGRSSRGRRPGANWLERDAIGWKRAFWLLIAALAIWILFQTGNRGALLGLVAGAVAMPLALALWGNRRALRPVALAAGGILFAVAALFLFDRSVGLPSPAGCDEEFSGTFSSRILNTSLNEGSVGARIALVGIASKAFMDRPILGWGQDNFARAFDKHAKASIYKYGNDSQDQAHNKVLEELATKGILGATAYLTLWSLVVWMVIRRRRPPEEEALAYAVLGALTVYFVQNLVLFDTPAMLLQWALLVGWVAGQEEGYALQVEGARVERVRRPLRSFVRRSRAVRASTSRLSSLPLFEGPMGWARGGVIIVVVVFLAFSLYFLNYRPYHAADKFEDAYLRNVILSERLILAQESFDTFQPLSNNPRMNMFRILSSQWNNLGQEDRELVLEFIGAEADRGLKTEPGNARLLVTALPILQSVTSSPEELDPLLERLREAAPERVYTHQRLAEQEIRKGNFQEAIRIAEVFEAQAPGTETFFAGIKRVASEALKAQQESS